MTKLKALSVIQCREYVLEQHGPDGVAQLKAAMSDIGREQMYCEQLLPTDWVEVAHGVEHARVFDTLFGRGDGRTSARMIRELTTRHMTGLYRSVLAATAPLTMLEKSSRLWHRYYDQGETQIEILSPTSVIKRLVGCQDLPLYHDWLVTPYYEELLRHCGATDLVLNHVKCVARGGDCCETEIRWGTIAPPGNPFDL
jgi:hypothetical protein